MAAWMIRMASSSAICGWPTCQPPKQIWETFTPVFPSGRVGRPAMREPPGKKKGMINHRGTGDTEKRKTEKNRVSFSLGISLLCVPCASVVNFLLVLPLHERFQGEVLRQPEGVVGLRRVEVAVLGPLPEL